MLTHLKNLLILLLVTKAGSASAFDCAESRVLVYSDKEAKCLKQKNGDCFAQVAETATAFLNGNVTPEGSGRQLMSCSTCKSMWGSAQLCAFYGYCRRRELEALEQEPQEQEQHHTPMLRGNRELTTAAPVSLGKLADFGLAVLGSGKASLRKSPIGVFGDIFVNGVDASEVYEAPVHFEGTLYTSASTLNEWSGLYQDNAGTATLQKGETDLLTQLQNDFNHALESILAMEATPGYTFVHAEKGLDGANFKNGKMDVVVIDIKQGFKIEKPVHIFGDSYDLIILRWNSNDDFSAGLVGKVEFKGNGGIYPAGGLTVDRLIHVAKEIKGSDQTVDQLVSVGDYGELPANGFFIGNWLVTDKADLGSGGNIIGGLYSNSDADVIIIEGNALNVGLGISWMPDEEDETTHDIFEEGLDKFFDNECWDSVGVTEDLEFMGNMKQHLQDKFGPDIELMTFIVQCKKTTDLCSASS